jgi:periplasmic divalent cation tolerance protein
MPKILIISTTFDKELKCIEFAKAILDLKLCACCQISQIRSLYNWKSKLNDEVEFKLECKTLKKNELLDYIKNNHSYDLPEIIIQELETTESY